MGAHHHHQRTLLLVAIALSLLVVSSTASIASHSEHKDERATGENDRAQIKKKEKDGDLSPDDGLLELQIIGYTNAVTNFIEVDAENVREKIANGDRFYLYTGRLTCQWCRKLAPSLYDASHEMGIDIYYLDSSNTEIDNALSSFRDEFAIETVPSVIFFDGNRSATELTIDVNAEDIHTEIEEAFAQLS